MQKSKVTIIGAGIPGLTLSLILGRAGLMVTIIDKAAIPTSDDIKPSGRTTALMQNSLEVLHKADIWPSFKEYATALKRLSIIDDSNYPHGLKAMVRQDFDANELGLDVFGYNVPLLMLTAKLAEKARAHENITVLDNYTVNSNSELISEADLIVGADGRNSIVRNWSDIDVTVKEYGQSAITCLISHAKDHNYTSTEFHRSGGPCTFVPFGDNHSAVVWVEKTKNSQDLIKLSRPDFIQSLQAHSRDVLGNIDLFTDPECRPLITLKADTMIAPKTVLIAEAAHVLSPIGAQGLNMSLRDVDDLGKMLIAAVQNGENIGSLTLLRRYERKRQRDIAPRQLGVDMFNSAVASDNPLVKNIRRAGLHLLGLGGPLRSFVIEKGLAPKS